MVVQESNLQENTYEEEETLSLSDLPSYSHVEWEEEEGLSSSDQDFSEFNFSQELSPSAATEAALSLPENVVFCGKLIPYKQPSHVSDHKDPSRNYDSAKKQVAHGKKTRRGGGSTRCIDQSKNGDRKDRHVQSSVEGSDYRLCKMSILTTSSSGKARWYQFFFGIRSFSTKMELRDIRSRQNRRQYSSPPPSPLLSSSRDQVVSQGRSRGRWGFWAVISALSCGGNHQTETSVTPFIA